MIIGLEDSLRIMMEQLEYDISRNRVLPANRLKRRKIMGIILSDTYNNPFFPVKFDTLRIDKAYLNLPDLRKEFRRIYKSPFKDLMLPWHFYVELIGNHYSVFNTRPINMKFPLTNEEVPKDIDKDTKTFLRRNLFDISELIHVVICGDTSKDIYTKSIYETIGTICISPILRLNDLPLNMNQRWFPLGIGERFDLGLLEKYLLI